MKTKKKLIEEYLDFLYAEFKNDEMYAPDVRQSMADFSTGFSASKKLTDKIILDLLNKYRSKQSNEQIPKLGKTANFEKEVHYKACIEVLLELQNKFK